MNANRQLPKNPICKQRMCVQLSNGETQLSNEDPRPGQQQTPPSSQAPSMTYFQQPRPMANGAPPSQQPQQSQQHRHLQCHMRRSYHINAVQATGDQKFQAPS
jgi:hypothetical protein